VTGWEFCRGLGQGYLEGLDQESAGIDQAVVLQEIIYYQESLSSREVLIQEEGH
jgi:hypothetical protein